MLMGTVRSIQEGIGNLELSASLPAMLIHEALLEGPVFQVADEIPMTLTASSGASPSGIACGFRRTVRWRGIVSRRRLQPDWLVRIQVTDNSLQSRWDTRLLLVHCRRTLPSCTCGSLRI